MNLRDVITSSGNINASFPDFIREKTGLTKLLGVRYNTDSDEFSSRNITGIQTEAFKAATGQRG